MSLYNNIIISMSKNDIDASKYLQFFHFIFFIEFLIVMVNKIHDSNYQDVILYSLFLTSYLLRSSIVAFRIYKKIPNECLFLGKKIKYIICKYILLSSSFIFLTSWILVISMTSFAIEIHLIFIPILIKKIKRIISTYNIKQIINNRNDNNNHNHLIAITTREIIDKYYMCICNLISIDVIQLSNNCKSMTYNEWLQIKNVDITIPIECSVCFDEYEPETDITVLYCGHIYHAKCITDWMNKQLVCPICQNQIKTSIVGEDIPLNLTPINNVR